MDAQTEALSDLDQLISQAETEAAQVEQAESEPVESVKGADDDGAGNLAALLVQGLELGFKSVDSRVEYTVSTVDEGREKLGPILSRFNLGASADKVPYTEEIAAGWFLGKLIKSSILRIRELWALDKKKAGNNGDKRTNGTEQPAPAMASEVGAREVNGDQKDQGDPGEGGAGYFVGPQQRPQSPSV